MGNYENWWFTVDAEKLVGESLSRVPEDKLAAREKPIISGAERPPAAQSCAQLDLRAGSECRSCRCTR